MALALSLEMVKYKIVPTEPIANSLQMQSVFAKIVKEYENFDLVFTEATLPSFVNLLSSIITAQSKTARA